MHGGKGGGGRYVLFATSPIMKKCLPLSRTIAFLSAEAGQDNEPALVHLLSEDDWKEWLLDSYEASDDSIVVLLHDNDLEYALHIVLNHIGVLLKGQVVAFILVTSVIV